MAEQFNGGNPIAGFDKDTFTKSKINAVEVSQLTADGEKIKSDIVSGTLNLTVGKNSRYECLRQVDKISDIKGLNTLTLDANKIILDNNNLKTISEQDFKNVTALTSLSLASNEISSFVSNLKLSELNLSNNKITQIDLTAMEYATAEDVSINLSSNLISDYKKIVFPATKKLSSLNLSFNNLMSLSEQDIENINARMMQGQKASIILQGVTDFNNVTAGDSIMLYSDAISNFKVKFSYAGNIKFGEEIFKSSGELSQKVYIPAGKIKVEFFSGNNLINAQTYPTLETKIIQVPLKPLDYKIEVKEKEVTSLNQDANMKITFFMQNLDNIPNKADILQNAKIYYARLGMSETQGNILEINGNGGFEYSAYVVFDEIESESIILSGSIMDWTGITIGIVLIVIVFVIVSAIYFLVRWIREGGNVAPLSEKEISKLNRKHRMENFNRESYIEKLDEPRHNNRVSDMGYGDDYLSEDLNEKPRYYDEYDPKQDNDDYSSHLNTNNLRDLDDKDN